MEYSQILKDLRRESGSVRNRIQSIIFDTKYVAQFSEFPLVANERCGLWYVEPHNLAASVYFKSTDGHTGQWRFSMRRLNFHMLDLFVKAPALVLVDSTRKGKLMPDALSKTVPMWCAVLNYIMFEGDEVDDSRMIENNWLITPREMVSASEHSTMVNLVPQHAREVQKLGLISKKDIVRRLGAKKPIVPHWVYPGKQSQVVRVSDKYFSVCCLTASYNTSSGMDVPDWFFPQPYVQGAADDHELWASSAVCEGNLDHHLLWKEIYYEPSEELRVIDMATGDICLWLSEEQFLFRIEKIYENSRREKKVSPVVASNLRDTGIFIGTISRNLSFSEIVSISDSVQHIIILSSAYGVVNLPERSTVKTHLFKIDSSKKGSKKLREILPNIISNIDAVNSASKVIILCDTGKDLSVAVALSILCRQFTISWEPATEPPHVNKDIIRQHLCLISDSRRVNPSRSTLQAVNTYLM